MNPFRCCMQLSYQEKPFHPMRRTPAAHRIMSQPMPSQTYRTKNSVKHWRNTQAPGFQRLQRPEHTPLNPSLLSDGILLKAQHGSRTGARPLCFRTSCSSDLVKLPRTSRVTANG
ncbi:hypothetical protein ONS95_014624 [Cadophora gregata]|uniref:uncharacterized protein n=1 Tax=Cadophora gregata TaxID=51156 RepID=UPI0026DD5E04|nr:uncharacterized protein ONS95_014624 [Cadophora gregata]KAK0112905.1 hypothetical protein ONS95_014624 [Cadophora gregata]KAK0125031.1 hypothetical protein ONS96_008897 [Cadophora gregata f. sp. sojae]